jgi:phenylacetate-CoA ligase
MNRSAITFALLGMKHGFSMKNMLSLVYENQYWSKDRIYSFQLERVRAIVRHAFDTVPYYKRIIGDLGFDPRDIKSLDDLKKLPIISKQEIIEDYSSFKSDLFTKNNPMERSTGGTTGIPFRYYNDRLSWGLNWATKIRTFSWGGYRFGADKIAVLKGGSMERKGNFSPKTMFWKYLHNYYTIPIINMTSESMDYHYNQITRRKIRFIRGFPSALFVFAKYLQSKGVTYRMDGVFTSAEVLYDYQRSVIENVFGHYIIDAYGCGDGMAGANQCEFHHDYHVNIETSYLEVITDSGTTALSGEEGNVVLTSLYDYSMPLIRYMPGDRAIPSSCECPCGRTLPLLSKILGRSADLFYLPNGRVFNGLSVPFEDWDDRIEKFQLIHEQPDLVVLKLVPRANYTQEDSHSIKKLLAHNLGDGVDVRIDTVNEIEQTHAGKFRYIVSKVGRP